MSGKGMATLVLPAIRKMILKLPLNYDERQEIGGKLRQIEGVCQRCWGRLKARGPELAPLGLVGYLETVEELN